jgi:phage terminase small subunit
VPAPTTPVPNPRPLLPRQELFAYHAARGASLAQASRLAGYSPQGARQRGSVLMANSDVRLRVEEFRRAWMAERDASIAEAVEETGQVVETALRLNRPTAALKAIELKLKLPGIIHDRRFSLYTESPDDDLSTCLFDPREDEDPPLEPLAEAPASPTGSSSAEPPAIAPPEPASIIPVPHPQGRRMKSSIQKSEHVIIVPGGLLATGPHADPGCSVPAHEVNGDLAQDGQVAGRRPIPDAAVILAEGDIQDPMEPIFYGPVTADRLNQHCRIITAT